MRNVTRDVNTLGNTLKNAGKSMTMKATIPIAGVLGSAIKVGTEFQYTMAKVKAISGATGDEFLELKRKAEDMGASTKWTAKFYWHVG